MDNAAFGGVASAQDAVGGLRGDVARLWRPD